MFTIGICIYNTVRKEEIYIWVMRWATRHSKRIAVKKYERMQEALQAQDNILLVDEENGDCKRDRNNVLAISSTMQKNDVQEHLSRSHRSFLSDEESYVYYQRPKYKKEMLSNILYFTSDRRKIIMHCLDGNHEFYDTLNQVEEEVCSKNNSFIRTHQSHLINRKYISQYNTREIILKSGEILTISKNRKRSTKKKLAVTL